VRLETGKFDFCVFFSAPVFLRNFCLDRRYFIFKISFEKLHSQCHDISVCIQKDLLTATLECQNQQQQQRQQRRQHVVSTTTKYNDNKLRSLGWLKPFRCAMWHHLTCGISPSSFLQPDSVHCPPVHVSPHTVCITSSQSPPSLPPSITPSAFHSRLKTHLFYKSFHPLWFLPDCVHASSTYTLCSEKTPTHIFFHISMNYLWI